MTGAFFNVTVGSNANVLLGTFNVATTLGDDDTVALERANNTITAGNADAISILWGDFEPCPAWAE